MVITYIHHSCFCVELDSIVMIFDYYKGDIPKFDSSKHIFVLASHKHYDHFNREVFELAKNYPNITFILSDDIPLGDSYLEHNTINLTDRQHIVRIKPNERTSFSIHEPNNSDKIVKDNSFELSLKDQTIEDTTQDTSWNLQIETLASTDEGIAFIATYHDDKDSVKDHDKVIYHAGDLNWWSWQGETKEEYVDMTTRFKHEMSKLSGKHIDVAFVPLDPRQEDRFWWGFDYFMRTTHTNKVFPMHFWKDYTIITKLKSMDKATTYKNIVMDINEEGQKFIL